MSSVLRSIMSLEPIHLLVYGSLLGTQLYQSFLMTGLSYQALPRTQFRSLQKRVFPIYFRTQFLLVIATTATYSLHSFLSPSRSWHEWAPLAIMFVTCFLNWKIYGPRTLKAMVAMSHQEARDGYTRFDAPKSDEMKAIGRKFSREHAMSIHLNLLTILGTIWYGYVLAYKIVPIWK